MSEYIDGEYIPLFWSYGNPDFYLVCGHVSKKVALSEVASCESLQVEDLDGMTCWHAWCRWSMCGSGGECDRWARIYDAPGRGRFKVTVLE
jgi:hypothetical protein